MSERVCFSLVSGVRALLTLLTAEIHKFEMISPNYVIDHIQSCDYERKIKK